MNGYMNMALGALLGTVFVLFSVSLASEGLYHSENPEKPGFIIEGEEVASAEGAKEEAPAVPIADLMVSLSTDQTNVKQGDLLTYFVRVQNHGPETAPNVVVTNVLSSGVTFVSARANRGALTAPPAGETGTVTWNLGDMLDHANEVADIVVTVIVRGKTAITNTASAMATMASHVSRPSLVEVAGAATVVSLMANEARTRWCVDGGSP